MLEQAVAQALEDLSQRQIAAHIADPATGNAQTSANQDVGQPIRPDILQQIADFFVNAQPSQHEVRAATAA